MFKLFKLLFSRPRRPEPVRLAPTLAQTGDCGDMIPTVVINLADLRRCRSSSES